MLNTLQIILHLPLINVQFPQNVNTFFSYLINIAEFQIIPTDKLEEKFTNTFNTGFIEDTPMPDNFVELGYENSKLIKNIGNIGFILVIYVLSLGVMFLIKLIAKRVKFMEKVYKYLEGILLFNFLFRIIIEGYLKYCNSVFISLKNESFDTISDIINTSFTIVFLILVAASPIYVFIFLKRNKHQLEKYEVVLKYEAIYEKINIEKGLAVYYNVMFLVKRLIFSASLVFLGDYVVF